MIELEHHDGIALVRLAHGKVNALDLELCEALTAQLDELEANGASAVVVTGAGKAFSAGVDLRRVLEGGGYGERFLPALAEMFVRWFATPLPVVAAVNGYAIAGGCILACCADHRVMAASARIGATELAVGVPFPAAALEVLRFACGVATPDVALGAQLHGADGAVRLRLTDQVTDDDDVVARAMARAATLAAVPARSFALVKEQLRRPTLERIAADGPGLDRRVAEVWSSPAVADAITASMERTRGGR